MSASEHRTIAAPAPPAGPHWLNAERVRVYSWMVVVIFGLGAAIWTALSLPGLVDPNGKPVGYDFIAFWSAARLAIEGRPEAAYEWAAIAAMHRVAVPGMQALVFAWHYPPTFLLAVLPLGLLAYPAALGAFTLASVGLWAALVRRIAADRRAWIAAAAAPAGLISLLDGQNGFLTAGLAGFALVMLQARRPVLAGMLIGLLAIKPHLAVLFPIALLAERQWRAMATAAATAALFAAASIAVLGWATLSAFLHDLPASRALIDSGAIPWGGMPSPYVSALSLGVPPTGAMVLQAFVALFAAVCVYRAWRSPTAPFEAKAATLLAGAMLVSPFLFNYDLTWAALAAGWLALLGLRIGFFRWEREVLLFAWLVPVAMAPVHALTAIQPGFPALLLLLLAAVQRAAPFGDADVRRRFEILTARFAACCGEAKCSPAMLPWAAAGAVSLFDFLMGCRLGWRVTGWVPLATSFAVLAAVGLGYGLSGRSPRLACTANWCLLWGVFTVAGAILTYIGGASGARPYDALYIRIDLMLGFDWLPWFEFVDTRPGLKTVLGIGYASMAAQILLSTLYFSWAGLEHKNRELLLNALLGIVITTSVFATLPALGPIFTVPPLHHAYDSYLTELLALRDGSFGVVDLSHLKGIIVFPSFHTVMAILLTYVHRNSRLLMPAALLNGWMLLSIPIIGGHYLTDIIGGAAVAGLTVLVTRVVEQRYRPAASAATI